MKYEAKVLAFEPKYINTLHVYSYDNKYPTGKAVVLADITKPNQFRLLELTQGHPLGTFRRVLMSPIDYTACFQIKELFGGESNLEVGDEELLKLQLLAANYVVEYAEYSDIETHQKKLLLEAIRQPQVYLWTIKKD